MNEQAAIRLLRLLIPVSEHPVAPELPVPSSTQDWCCGAHAIVASLVFAMLGQKTHVAQGRAYLFAAKLIVPVVKHYFVVRDGDGKVFDSSITMPMPPHQTNVRFEGIGFNGNPDCPAMLATHSRSDPTKYEMDKMMEHANEAPLLLYIEHTSYRPEEMMEMKMSGTSGKRIEQTFGSQFGLWPRFAWVIAEQLRANSTTDICFDRERLIQKIKATPSETLHKIKTICRKLQ